MLTICPTPIGNLDDLSARQRRALASADVIACEDTRRTGKLLELVGVERVDGRPRLLSYHEHNELERLDEILDALGAGEHVVLTSDAGTPTIADPGYRLVAAAAEAGFEMEVLPGPSAVVTAISGSGLPTDRFLFEGFLPSKSKARRDRLGELAAHPYTVVCYESPYRIVETLDDVCEICGEERRIVVARELTKMHEEFLRGTAGDVHNELAGRDELHGEFVLLVAPSESEVDDQALLDQKVDEKIAELLDKGMRPRGIKEVVSELYDVRRSELYDRIERVKGE